MESCNCCKSKFSDDELSDMEMKMRQQDEEARHAQGLAVPVEVNSATADDDGAPGHARSKSQPQAKEEMAVPTGPSKTGAGEE